MYARLPVCLSGQWIEIIGSKSHLQNTFRSPKHGFRVKHVAFEEEKRLIRHLQSTADRLLRQTISRRIPEQLLLLLLLLLTKHCKPTSTPSQKELGCLAKDERRDGEDRKGGRSEFIIFL